MASRKSARTRPAGELTTTDINDNQNLRRSSRSAKATEDEEQTTVKAVDMMPKELTAIFC